MSTPSIADTRRALIATPGKTFDLSSRDTGDKSLFEDKERAERHDVR